MDGTFTDLAKDTDYTVEYVDNTDAGTAFATITGKGAYIGTQTVSFTIEKASNVITVATTAVSKIGNISKTQTFTRAGAATSGTVTYVSSNTKIATGDKNGKVTIKKNATGTVKISK